jgi:hypothetical protein
VDANNMARDFVEYIMMKCQTRKRRIEPKTMQAPRETREFSMYRWMEENLGR